MLRSMLGEFYPAALVAFGDDLAGRDAMAVLAVAPSPDQGRRLSTARVATVLRRAGRQRNHAAAAERIVTALGTEQVGEGFGRHPDAEIYLSQPGLGEILGARVLAEFGDDPHRYADSRARKNYSGMAPVTKASGKSRVVLARHTRNRRLGDALYLQSFAALSTSPGARRYYDDHRTRGNTHHQALRALANRLVGILDGCLRHRKRYDETIAWPNLTKAAA